MVPNLWWSLGMVGQHLQHVIRPWCQLRTLQRLTCGRQLTHSHQQLSVASTVLSSKLSSRVRPNQWLFVRRNVDMGVMERLGPPSGLGWTLHRLGNPGTHTGEPSERDQESERHSSDCIGHHRRRH